MPEPPAEPPPGANRSAAAHAHARDVRAIERRSGVPDQPGIYARLAVAATLATGALLVGEAFTIPDAGRGPAMAVTGLAGLAVIVATWFVPRRASSSLLVLAGLGLMALGVAAGAFISDGLDGAALLPLGGAVLILPTVRGRRLALVFALAFATSMAGETAAYLVGGMRHIADEINPAMSLLQSAVMLIVAYGLVWGVSDRWRAATAESEQALAGQRRLLEVNERLLSTLDPDAVLNLIADSLKSVLAYDNLTIYRVDRDLGQLRAVLARDRFATLILEATFPVELGITGWVVRHGLAQCVNDSHLDPRTRNIPGTPPEPESLIVVPLLVGGEVVGTLNVGRMGEEESHFSASEFELARLFAGQASIALQNAEAHSALSTRAQTDGLTGLRNRGAVESDLEELLGDPRAEPVALVLLDLDRLKMFNDRYGHPAGDALLRSVGRCMRSCIREGDLAYRYGGDEFAVVLPRTSTDAAAEIATRIGRRIAALRGAHDEPVTASSGVASHPVDGSTRDGLLAAADARLYRSKESGGDRVDEGDGPRPVARQRPATPRDGFGVAPRL